MGDIQTDVLKPALRKCGIKSPSTAQIADALADNNSMISLWSIEGLLIPSVTKENFSITAGLGSRTIGSGGDFDTVRPTKIVDAFIRDSSNYDYPVDVHMSLQEYNDIADKTAQSRPKRIYYHPEYPLGVIYFDTPSDTTYTLYIDTEKPLTEFPLVTTSLALALEYKMAMIFNLTTIIAPDYGKKLAPEVIAYAVKSKQLLRGNNIKVRPVGVVSALRRSRGTMNINIGE